MCLRKSSCTFFAIAAMALAACGDGGDGSTTTTTTTGDPNPSGQLSDLLLTANQQERNASIAKTAADTALKKATEKAAMLSAVKVLGESSDARDNAQAVLDATDKVDQALKDADAALTALQKAKTEADKLPADTPKLQELKTSITAAITEATKHRDAVKAIKDAKATETGSLAAQRQMVTGVNGDMSPDDIEAMVAVAVEKAMVFADGLSSTYPKITGGETLTAKKVFTLGYIKNSVSTGTVLDEYDLRAIHDLPGVKREETDYANYGYWLGIPNDSDTIVETQIFGIPKREETTPVGVIADNPSLGNSAIYNGNALGISVMTADDGNGGQEAVKSGEFTADVRLTATFAGDASKVKGEIYNFEGAAVGDDWSIALKEATLLRYVPELANFGLTRGSGAEDDGLWHARVNLSTEVGYEAKRPMGISGTFTAFFPNGRAVGGYATVKETLQNIRSSPQ